MPTIRMFKSIRARLRRLAVLAALLISPPAYSAEVIVLGTPHLRQLEPAPQSEQIQVVVERLARFEPTLVCVEAMPGAQVAEFARSPERTGALLRRFALDAIRLAPEQQARLSVDAASALDAARVLERSAIPLDDDSRTRLIGLQLAGHEPWSAALNWTALPEAAQAAASRQLGADAVGRLRALAASEGEIARVAIPLARRLDHRRLCMVDSFVDELHANALAGELTPTLERPAVREGLERFARLQAAQWRAQRPDGLATLLAWINSEEFERADRAAQWTVFTTMGEGHDAGERRLAHWHARNAQIAADLFRNVASPEGGRVLLLIGAAHRPFIEDAIASQPWVQVRRAREVLR